jgi:hypothetical protein
MQQGSVLAIEFADALQVQATHTSKGIFKAHWICEDSLELHVPASNEYVNFKRKTEKECGRQCEDVAAAR